MIVSSTRGRVRLRDKSFKNPALPLDKLRSLTGVSQVEHNVHTGSILVTYVPEELDLDKCAQVLGELDPEALKTIADGPTITLEKPPCDKDPDKTLNETIGLIIAIISVLASGFLRQKKFHVMAGMFLVEMLFEHVWRFRHRLKGKFNIFSMLGIKRKNPQEPAYTGDGGPTITVLDVEEVKKETHDGGDSRH
ncbi:MAG: hypothetical protein LBE27_03820 [Deltaproteobacteria bacterium]|jgi:hypothetical protein|nr:hypothetical protein [Deltaproteobacteria bacterium]